MRLTSALINDILYQYKYRFYHLYLFISWIYMVIIAFFPEQYRTLGVSFIILSDPAMLGFFFIGGIWLLENNEGLHRYQVISPLKPVEYIISKSLSLSIIATLSAVLVVYVSLDKGLNYPILIAAVFLGAMIFTLFGLTLATYAKTLNKYLILSIPVQMLLVLPVVLTTLNLRLFVFEALPTTILWRVLIEIFEASEHLSWEIPLVKLLVWLTVSIL